MSNSDYIASDIKSDNELEKMWNEAVVAMGAAARILPKVRSACLQTYV
jgi:hypothetical protein